MSAPELWAFETRTGPETLKEIRSVFARLWEAHDEVPESVRGEIGIATGEIVANIIEHASLGGPVDLRMEVAVLPGEVQVRFIDNGQQLGVDLESARMPDGLAERGRGLAIARAVLRRLSYRRGPDGNHWTLISERFSG